MKKLVLLLWVVVFPYKAFTQTAVDQLLQAGVENAQRFSQDYFKPSGEAVINAMSNGWYTSAKVKKLFHFEIGLVGNGSFVREEKKSFSLNEGEYEGLTFRDPNPTGDDLEPREVASIFGANNPEVVMVVNEGQLGQAEITLPNGLGENGIGFVPTTFLQGSIGLPKSTELKVRFLPKFEVSENTEIQLYGVGVQHEFSDWYFPMKRWPVKISGILAYTNLKGSYDFTEDSSIPGSNQIIQLKSSSWLLSGIVSTKLPVLNFYGGLGLYSGSSNTSLLGTYDVQSGPVSGVTLTDPVSVDHKETGVKVTLGSRVKLGFFRFNLDYTLQNYQTLSLGMNFGW